MPLPMGCCDPIVCRINRSAEPDTAGRSMPNSLVEVEWYDPACLKPPGDHQDEPRSRLPAAGRTRRPACAIPGSGARGPAAAAAGIPQPDQGRAEDSEEFRVEGRPEGPHPVRDGEGRLRGGGPSAPVREREGAPAEAEPRSGVPGDLEAGRDRAGGPVHSFARYTANSTLLAAGVPETVIRARMGHVTSKMTERYFDPLADNGAGTGAVASLLGVEDGAAEAPAEQLGSSLAMG